MYEKRTAERPDVKEAIQKLRNGGMTLTAVFKDILELDINTIYRWNKTAYKMRDATYDSVMSKIAEYNKNNGGTNELAAITAKVDAHGHLVNFTAEKSPKELLKLQYCDAIAKLEDEQAAINVKLNEEQTRINALHDQHMAVAKRKMELEETVRMIESTYGAVMGYATATEIS